MEEEAKEKEEVTPVFNYFGHPNANHRRIPLKKVKSEAPYFNGQGEFSTIIRKINTRFATHLI